MAGQYAQRFPAVGRSQRARSSNSYAPRSPHPTARRAIRATTGDEDVPQERTQASSIPAGQAKRVRILMLAADGHNSTEIGQPVGVSLPTVRAWPGRYREDSLDRLGVLPRSGAPGGEPPGDGHRGDAVLGARDSRRAGHRPLLLRAYQPRCPGSPGAGRPRYSRVPLDVVCDNCATNKQPPSKRGRPSTPAWTCTSRQQGTLAQRGGAPPWDHHPRPNPRPTGKGLTARDTRYY